MGGYRMNVVAVSGYLSLDSCCHWHMAMSVDIVFCVFVCVCCVTV